MENIDIQLQEINPKLFMFPWIGEEYEKGGVLFLGDSDYSDGVNFIQDWKRKWIREQRIDGTKTDARLLNNIDSIILKEGKNAESQKKLWNIVAYTNLVQLPMDVTNNKKAQPSSKDLFDGWVSILQVILILKPSVIIKWGLRGENELRGNINNGNFEGWKYKHIQNDRFIELEYESDFKTKMLFLRHPSFNYNIKRSLETIKNTELDLDFLKNINS